MQGAAADPRNSGLLDLITRAAQGNISPREKLTQELSYGSNNFIKKVFGDDASISNPLTDYISWSLGSGNKVVNPPSNLSAAVLNKAVELSDSKTSPAQILSNRGSPLYEGTVKSLISTSLKSKLGLDTTKFTDDIQSNKLLNSNPQLKTIIDGITSDMLPALGIKDTPK